MSKKPDDMFNPELPKAPISWLYIVAATIMSPLMWFTCAEMQIQYTSNMNFWTSSVGGTLLTLLIMNVIRETIYTIEKYQFTVWYKRNRPQIDKFQEELASVIKEVVGEKNGRHNKTGSGTTGDRDQEQKDSDQDT